MPITSKGFPVLFTFDLDAETMWTSRDPKNAERPIIMSQGAYGWKVGLGRVLKLLSRYSVPATFFIPLSCAEDPTLVTDNPELTAGRTPELKRSGSKYN